ncbi:hybrid sensor histidine kinase/response regulator [Telluria sp. B2]
MMSRQVDHMVHLIDDLLDVARIDSGKIDLKTDRLDLGPVVASAVEASLPLIDAGHHVLELALPEEALVVDADATRLAQVVSNLLSNAAKYTPARGRIRLEVRRDDRDVLIAVSDTGIGIPAQALQTIFEMFVQVERSLPRAQGGLGIGLALVNRLVQMHGGAVTAQSPGEGQGSTFTIRLPLLADAPRIEPFPGERPASLAQPGEKPVKILVVDDNADAAQSMADLLRARRHVVDVANDGYQALEMIQALDPEVVFLDIGMPGLDGYEVASRVRRMPGYAHPMLVALTGWGAEHDLARARRAGFDHHLTKPAHIDAVEQLLASLPEMA